MHEWLDTERARARFGRPNVQETGETLDPQRQHAQLLGLWSQGSKLLRRFEYYGGERESLAAVTHWWNLARALQERNIAVLLLPVAPPLGLVGWGTGKHDWCTLVDVQRVADRPDPELYHHPMAVNFADEASALIVRGEAPILSDRLLRRFSARSLGAVADLVQQMGPSDALEIGGVEAALVVVAAWSKAPDLMRRIRVEDWEAVAQFWRHRSSGRPISEILDGRYPWLALDQHGDG